MSEGACPACRRPVAAQRASCLYCGSPLAAGRDVAAQGAGPVEHSDPTRARTLLVLDLGGANAARLERALGLSAFEAAQWTRRGGYRLHRIVDREQAEAETARLVEAGLSVLALVEAEVREAAQTLVALGGVWRGAALEVRTPEDRLEAPRTCCWWSRAPSCASVRRRLST